MSHRLRDTRLALGHIEQADYARAAGIGERAYNNYEQGYRIGLDAAIKLCDTYLLSLDWIYFGEPQSLLSMPSSIAQQIRDYLASQQSLNPAKRTKRRPLSRAS